jgi:hypothetical protein
LLLPPVKTIQGGKSEDVFFYRVCGIDSIAIDFARVIDFLYLFRYCAGRLTSERERASAHNEQESH